MTKTATPKHRATRRTPRHHALTVAAAATLTLGTLFTAAPAQAASSDITSVSTSTRATHAQQLLDLINAHRKNKGLKPVKYSATLSGIAQGQSDRLVRQEVVNHTNAFMTDPRAAGWDAVGEIHALSYQVSVKELMDFWKGSTGHNKVLTDPKMEVIGIGLTYADGSLANTRQPWRLVGTVASYGYPAGKGPADAATTVRGTTTAAPKPAPVATTTYTTKGGIGTKYRALGGTAAFGAPTMNERGGLVGGGVYQQFAKNSTFYWAPHAGAWPVSSNGAIGKKFAGAGYERGYGYPTTVERTGLIGGGAYQSFRTSSGAVHKILWAPGIGAKVVKESGAIGNQWKRAGYERGYGYPVTDEYRVGTEVRQKFSTGRTIHWSSVTKRTWVTR